jgi:hypothetical protein
MDEQQQNIDDIFRQSLGDYREVPPAATWDKVAARLDGDDPRRGSFQRWPWIMMILLLLIGGAWFVKTLYGRGAGADSGGEDAAKTTNTQTEVHQTAELNPTPAPGGTAEPVAEVTMLPGNEANRATDGMPSGLDPNAPAQVVASSENAPKKEVSRMAPASRRKSPVTAPVLDNSLTPTPSTASSTMATTDPIASSSAAKKPSTPTRQAAPTPTTEAITDAAAIATEPVIANKSSYKKTTVYGKMVVVEELPARNFETNLPPANTSIGSIDAAKGAAQNKTTAPEQELPASDPIASASPSAKQPTPASQKAVTTQSDLSLKQAKAATATAASPLNRNTVTATAKPTVDVKKRSEANNKPPVQTVAAATPAIGTPPTAKAKKQPQKVKHEIAPATATVSAATTASQTKTAPTAKDLPAKGTVASATPKAEQSTPASQKTSDIQKDPSRKQAKPAIVIAAVPPNKKTVASKDNPAVNSSNSKKADSNQPVQATAASIPVTGTIPSTTASKPAQKVKQQSTRAAEAVATSNKATSTSPALPLSGKKRMLAVQEPVTSLSAAPPRPAAQPKAQKEAAVSAKVQATTPGVADIAAGATPADSTSEVARPKYPMSLSAAVLGGFEFGMQSPAPGRFTAGARVLLHVSPRASIGLQPTIRYGTVAAQKLTDEKMYQRSVIDVNSFTSLALSPSIRNSTDTLYHYVVRETFDSIVVGSTTAGGKSLEFELPLIISYQLGSSLHVYGGPSLNFGGKLTVSDPSIQTYSVGRRDSLVQSEPMPSSEFVNYFGKSSLEEYSNYKPSSAALQDPVSARLGYIIGIGYAWKRILFDASMHQQVTGYEDVAPQLQKVYSSPYMRMSLGYQLFPMKKSQKNKMD